MLRGKRRSLDCARDDSKRVGGMMWAYIGSKEGGEGGLIRFFKKSGGRIWKYGEYYVPSQAVTTNHRCIGHQSSMKCVAGNRILWLALFARMG